MSQRLAHRASMLSLNSSRPDSRPRPSRNCSNCSCSPGLLSRQGRRSSIIAKRMSLRQHSGAGGLSRSNSRTSFVGSSGNCSNPREMNTSKRLEALRTEMKREKVAVYVIPSEDEHQSEYVAPMDQKRSFISGFSGSAGVAIVTCDPLCMNAVPEGQCVVSTDGRYFAQAEDELDFNWKLLKQGVKGVPSWQEWAIDSAIQMSMDSGMSISIGINPRLITYQALVDFRQKLAQQLAKHKNSPLVDIVPVQRDLVDAIWPVFEPVPHRRLSKLVRLDQQLVGESVEAKISKLCKILGSKHQALYFVLNSLDQIAWLLNLRGSDIEYNPIFYSYFVLANGRRILYCDMASRLDLANKDIPQYLGAHQIEIKPYSEFYADLKQISALARPQKVFLPTSATWSMVQALNGHHQLIDSPVELLKAVKNPTEISNFKTAHSKDGLACVKFFAWLEDQLVDKGELLNEYEAAEKQKQFRQAQPNFVDLSFETISATGKNAAIIHYAPPVQHSAIIDPGKLYLNDLGAQFLEGTTDVTRTVHFGKPTAEQRTNYTLVLKGNLALETLRFPEGTNGYMIDCIARQFLWSQGLDYKHGTSHGVGSFLNVHEGPIGIGFRPSYAKHPLQAGNVISNEPGYYKDNEYGIRIENVVYIDKVDPQNNSDKPFFKFVNLTRVPYCRSLIDTALLSKDQIQLINSYHLSILNEFKPQLHDDPLTYAWLKKQCQPL